MGFLQNIFESKEKKEYKVALGQVSTLLINKTDTLDERAVREFFKVILDAAEISLRGILFKAPEEFNFKKLLSKEKINFWLHKVSLALVAYSYYFFSVEEQSSLGQTYWQKLFDFYNKIFGKKITMKEIEHYAVGLKEDTGRGYSKAGDTKKVYELMARDYKVIGEELIKEILEEELGSNKKRSLFVGGRIWQAYQQIVQPFLPKLLSMETSANKN